MSTVLQCGTDSRGKLLNRALRQPGLPTVQEANDFLGRLQNVANPQKRMPASEMSAADWTAFSRGFGGAFRGAHYRGAAQRWDPAEYLPNAAWQFDAAGLRRRAWDLYNNNPFAQSAIDTLCMNAIGNGILWRHREEDRNKSVKRWCGLTAHATRECDIEQDSTFPELEVIWLREVLLSGGCLTNYVFHNRRSQRIPVSMELITEDRFADNLKFYGRNPKTRNQIILGREVNNFGRTVAYHILPSNDDFEINFQGDPIRIPAANAHYAYRKRKAGEKRGTPAIRTAILWLHALGYYFDREMFNANLRTRWAYSVERDPEWEPGDSDGELGEIEVLDAMTGAPAHEMQSGLIYNTTNGGTIKTIGPNVPPADSVPWLKLMERAIALSVMLSFEAVLRDTEAVSMGNLRYINLADKRTYEGVQDFAIHHLVHPTANRFITQAVIFGATGFPTAAEYSEQQDDILDSLEIDRPGWESFNPVEDAKADDINLRNGSTNQRRISRRTGDNWREEMHQTADERAERERLDIPQLEDRPAATAVKDAEGGESTPNAQGAPSSTGEDE